MTRISLSQIRKGSTLLKKVLGKIDDGDTVLTARELQRYKAPAPGKGKLDAATMTAAAAAINKSKGNSALSAIEGVIDASRDALLAADLNKDGFVDDAEAKKLKTVLDKALFGFVAAHGNDSLASLKLPKPSTAEVYVPKTPFRMPSNPTGDRVVDALVKHFNSFGNDNHEKSFGNHEAGRITTRFVLGEIEAKGIAAEIAKMPAATRKSVLQALAGRIQKADDRRDNWAPQRIWITPDAVGRLEAIASADGVKVNLRGKAPAPAYNYF